jgi:hypothetical protein
MGSWFALDAIFEVSFATIFANFYALAKWPPDPPG